MAENSTPTTLAEILEALRELSTSLAITPPELLDREAFAGLLGIGASTLDRHRETGDIGPQPVRLGGVLRWHRAEVLSWLGRRAAPGRLYDSTTWPAVWAELCRRNGRG